jgi:lipopolysaccharide/colanic/teichoic acid biosynthesis glycosyltransferase
VSDRRRQIALAVKRCFDLAAAVLGLAALVPFSAPLALAIVLDSPGPVFFLQERLGKEARVFQVWKLRTMHLGATFGAVRDRRDPRITRVGYWLRRLSIDELPQLINVLRGEMSLVGPRPEPTFRLQEYSDRHRKRLKVLPGITGLAQVSGRNLLARNKRYELDVQYVENWSLGLDASILFRTAVLVFRQEGVDYPPEEEA